MNTRFYKNEKFLFLSILFEIVTLISLVVGACVLLRLQYLGHQRVCQANQLRYDSYLLADQLRQSSDDLTRMVRSYAVTGNSRFENYFWHILDIRDGKRPRPLHYERAFWDFMTTRHPLFPFEAGRAVSLTALMKKAGFTPGELALLEGAKDRSDKLVSLEQTAMNAVKGRFLDDTGGFTVQGRPDFDMARQILFGEAYHIAKKEIMAPINDFFHAIDTRTLAQVNQANSRMAFYQTALVTAFGVLIINGLLLLLTASQYQIRIVSRLQSAIQSQAREITRRRQTEQALSESEAVTQTLLRISNATTTAKGLYSLAKMIHTILAEVIQAPNFHISLWDEADDSLLFFYARDEHQDMEGRIIHGIARSGAISPEGEIIRKQRPRLIKGNDLKAYPRAGAKVWLGVPLMTGEDLTGVMVVQDYIDADTYSGRELRLMSAVSEQVATAFDRKVKADALFVSERQHRIIFDSAPIGILHLNDQGMVIRCNEEFIRLMGATHESVIGFNCMDSAGHPDMKRAIRRAVCGKRSYFEGEYTSVTGGVTRYLREVCHPVEPGAESTEVIITVEDFTDRRNMEKALQRARDELRALFENLPVGIFRSTPDGRIISANPELARLMGYGSAESLYDGIKDLGKQAYADPEKRGEFLKILDEKGYVKNYEFRSLRRDKTCFWASLSAKGQIGDDGQLNFIDGYLQDITQAKEMKQTILEAKEAAERAARAKGDFLARMSHEIRTPMNAILGMSDLLAETRLDSEQQEYVQTLHTSGELLLAIINDILDFSKIEAGHVRLESIGFDIRELVQNIGRILKPRADEKGLGLFLDVSPEVPRFLLGDPTRLKQILINLMGNAVKFTAKGRVHIRVSQAQGRAIRFEIQDTGPGIARDKQDSIFNSFSQADGSITRRFGGTGLGLTISKSLVELMGGQIRVTSETGQGTTFVFTVLLPEARPGTVRELSPIDPDQTAWDIAPTRLLLVEDIPANRKVIHRFLKGLPVSIIDAENGAQALEIMAARRFDLVLMDREMPVMDGLTATRAIRRREKERGEAPTPVVELTAHAFGRHRDECLEAGCDEFLVKPVSKSDILGVISRYQGKRQVGKHPGRPVARAPADMEALIPEFLHEAGQAVKAMAHALETRDFKRLKRLAHGYKGAAASYGMQDLSGYFRSVESAVENRDPKAVGSALSRAGQYLETVNIRYV